MINSSSSITPKIDRPFNSSPWCMALSRQQLLSDVLIDRSYTF